MKLRLPPLNTLRLFEAAGRHLSFKKAAEELHVTPSAVSHGIQTLEAWLHVPLFHRTRRGLALTEAGTSYLPCVREALTLLAKGSDVLPGRQSGGTIAISSAPTFAARWLIPNLPRFRAEFPDIEVAIDTSYRRVEFPMDGVDVAIRVGQEPSGRLESILLVSESLFPVCSPRLVSEMGHPLDLAAAPLIHVSTVSEDWPTWAEAAGVPGLDLGRGLRVDTIGMAFDAAIQGLGVMVGRAPLVDSDIAAGRLVQCHPVAVPATRGHWLVYPREAIERAEVAAFTSWILREMGRDERAPADGPERPRRRRPQT
ncbi:MAG TPA: transcriptional regulator GcvA [Afifellaceae bacterium]|nr:transcriptional regulator GcvA [Afifellaceae bacterium]